MRDDIYLSIIIAVRNDDHGGNFIKRFQNCLNSIFYLNRKYPFFLEIVVVEWNTPYYKPSISQYIDLKNKPDSCLLEFIYVPPHIHSRYKYSKRLPLYQMIAKNVGIRRSRGEFILCTNADIIFSEPLFKFLYGKGLEKNKIYRVIRVDVDNKRLDFESYDELLDYCTSNVLRINGYNSFANKSDDFNENYWIYLLNEVERYNFFSDSAEKISVYFTNACGDFQLMHREHWFDLRGYPEFDKYSFHIDSILQYQAVYYGIKEETLSDDKCVYHIEHESGFVPEKASEFENKHPEGFRLSYGMLNFYRLCIANKKLIFNGENWGLANELLESSNFNELPQITFVAVPREFEGEFEYIQYNAIMSWLNLSVSKEIILVCDEGIEEYIKDERVKYVRELKYTKYAKPNLKSVFSTVKKYLKTDYVVFVNCDIIFLDDFSKTLKKIIEKLQSNLFLVGRRTNVNIKDKINFKNIHWWDEVYKLKEEGCIGNELSLDYFIFHRSFLDIDFPEFSIGGMYWDNWLLSEAFKKNLIIIDVTDSISALHQNHSYRNNISVKDILNSEMAKSNFKLMGGNINKKNLNHVQLTFLNSKFYYKNGHIADIERIKFLHAKKFNVFEDLDEHTIQYVSYYLSNDSEKFSSEDEFLKNLDILSYNPDRLFNFAFDIIYKSNRNFLELFSIIMEKVAENGYLNGDNYIGLRYNSKSNSHIEFWNNEILKGNAEGKLILSFIFFYGLGCEKDEEKALSYMFDYYKDNKNDLFIKLLFFHHILETKNDSFVIPYIEYFKTEHDREVYFFLGIFYSQDRFYRENKELSKKYFSLAAEMGNPKGFNYLGIKSLMNRDIDKSMYFFELGSSYGDSIANKNLKMIKNKIIPAE